jgi:Sec-independent protein translocase protein TatA
MLVLISNPLMLGSFIGGWEALLILAVTLILVGAARFSAIAKGVRGGLYHLRKEVDNQAHDAGRSVGGIYGKLAAEALSPDNQTAELYDPAVFEHKRATRGWKKIWFRRWVGFWRSVWRIIQGLGIR